MRSRLFLGSVIIAGSSAAAQTYTVVDLGSFGGKLGSAWGINDAGTVVGESQDSSGRSRAFYWTPTSGITDLGTLGGVAAGALDINGLGVVVGWARNAAGLDRAFRWSPGTGMTAVPGLPTTRPCYARGINDAGRIVGTLYNSLAIERAFMVDSALGVVDPLPASAFATSARAVNSLGRFIGHYSTTGTDTRGYVWLDVGVWNTISSQAFIDPYGMNDNGQVVGTGGSGAFRWTSPSTSVQSLTTAQVSTQRAYAVSRDGSVVGYGLNSAGNRIGFVYTDCLGTRDVNTMLAPGTPLTVNELRDLNAQGKLVGVGTNAQGELRPVLLIPSSPPCSSNCDCSTATPVLTSNDFQCFLNLFASGSTRANCDLSSTVPMLTSNDFQCFLNRFAEGCS